METLQIERAKALKAYQGGNPDIKAFCETLWDKKILAPDICDRIQNLDDVFRETGTDKEAFYKKLQGLDDDTIAYEEGKLIADAYNEGTKLRTADTNQYKYGPYFKVIPDASKPAGFALSYHGYDGTFTLAFLGARLRVANPDHAIDAGKKFADVYARMCP